MIQQKNVTTDIMALAFCTEYQIDLISSTTSDDSNDNNHLLLYNLCGWNRPIDKETFLTTDDINVFKHLYFPTV